VEVIVIRPAFDIDKTCVTRGDQSAQLVRV
jgi:hypothetical protein